jgi:hypothetical protein
MRDPVPGLLSGQIVDRIIAYTSDVIDRAKARRAAGLETEQDRAFAYLHALVVESLCAAETDAAAERLLRLAADVHRRRGESALGLVLRGDVDLLALVRP